MSYDNYILEKIFIATNVPIFVFDDKNNIISLVGAGVDSKNPRSPEFAIFIELLKELDKNNQPTVDVKDDNFVYFTFSDDKNYRYIVGPHILESDNSAYLYLLESDCDNEISRLIHRRCEKILNDFYLYYWCVMQKKISSAGISGVDKIILSENGNIEQEINKYRLQKNEQELKHLTYAFENNYITAIEYGQTELFAVQENVNSDLVGNVGVLANDSLKQVEYMCASANALISRAAIRGGVTPSEAYEMSELYFQKLEKCQNKLEMVKLHLSLRAKFTEMVRDVKLKQRNIGYVEQCKDYIVQNVYTQLRVDEIAKKIGINSNYLSRKFTEQEGLTISQFIVKARLKVACDLLKHSNMGIAEISEYLCFASQSHFGRLFKKEYEMSPLQYKKKNMIIEVK